MITSANVDQYAEDNEIRTVTSPQICCHTTFQKISTVLYSSVAKLMQIKVMQKRLITVNFHDDADSLFICTY